ncbi:hypothetical protein BJX61DRAFT_524712 [Aspergillus egyptiacus]|nr:hypothetical protein BJX61DRAFT_524712 [Aspergillus egyptiacus]
MYSATRHGLTARFCSVHGASIGALFLSWCLSLSTRSFQTLDKVPTYMYSQDNPTGPCHHLPLPTHVRKD